MVINNFKVSLSVATLCISTSVFSNSWILDKSNFENTQPTLNKCINVMKKGVLVNSEPINRNQPLDTYIYADDMYSVRWNKIDQMLVCYYDGKLVSSKSNESQDSAQILPR
jgi:hypothetical protein